MATPLRVLVIDDSESDAELVVRTLARAGYAPHWRRVWDAPALDAALTERWDLVLCDWRMPGFSGAAALVQLRDRAIDAPIIIVSSDLGEEGAIAAMKGGAHDFVSKRALARLTPAVERELREADTRRALRISEERFGKVFDFAPIGMTLVSTKGVVLRVNAAFCAMLGYSPEEMLDVPVWQFTHPDDLAPTFEQLRRLLEGEIDTWHLEKRFLHRDGGLVWGLSTSWLVRDALGVGEYVVSNVQDITERRRRDEEARQQRAVLAQGLRVATVAETVAQVAQEVAQPLAAIGEAAQALLARLDRHDLNPLATRATALGIADQAARAGRVIERMRQVLRTNEPEPAHCDANAVVRGAVHMLEGDLRRHGIGVELALAPEPLPVGVGSVQLEQVVVNLLQNAVDAIAAGADGIRRLAVESALVDAHTVMVRVRDSGIGLPADTDILAPFVSTKPGALGLGLSICASIVRAHGGAVWAAPNAERGATVGFTLPRRVAS